MNCSSCKFSHDDDNEYLCPCCGGYEKLNLFSQVQIYIRFLKNLSNKTATLMDKLKKEGVPRDDIRRTKLGDFNILTLATIFDLMDYDKDIRYDDSRIPKEITKSNPHFSHETMKELVENTDIRNKVSYLVISLFQFENLFTELAKNKGFSGNENYSAVVRYVIDKSNLENKTEKIDALILPSLIRNTLHSGAVYYDRNNKDKELRVKNILFKFEHGKENHYLSWRELIFYFNNVIEIISEILDENKD